MEVLNQQTIKGYELKECLGEGAYGAVYRATQPQVGREVAIKIILPEYANRPEFIRRFGLEAQLVAQLEHMNIVPLYDYWREPDGAFLVMRLMKGGSLADSLREGGPWEPAEAVRLVDQIAAALEAAHQQGVVHRDLKPANILLDETGNAYLSDFGIAKELGAEVGLTQTGAIVGTPAYITPEQVQSQAVTPQTDIYALGVVLYELLTGDHPFAETPTGALIVKHVNEPLPLVRHSCPELPAEVDQIIQKATAKDPAGRYPDALTVAAELRRALQLEVALPVIPEGEITNPYKGLRAFQEVDADDFFGREALTGKLLARLMETPTLPHRSFDEQPAVAAQDREGGSENRFLAVVGPSGSGKSSVVNAGLVPALRKGALPGSEQWFIIDMVPKAHPIEELDINLSRISTNQNVNIASQLERGGRGLLRAGRMVLPSSDGELLVIVDQFEELFTLVEDEAEARHFMDLIYSATTDPHSQVRVIITLRADFYDRPLMYPNFSRLVEAHTALILPLTPEELEQAIRAPAERVGVLYEKGLIPAVIADVVDQPGALPLLQYALTELFEHREGRLLTCTAYQSIGGVLGALGRRAEEVYSCLAEDGKEYARQLFLRLVALGEGTDDTRRRALRSELDSLFSNQQSKIINVIDVFGQARLLTFDHDPETRGSTVEVAHEALLREWRRLREWLDESQADVRIQRALGNAATEWQAANQDSSFLLRGTRLAQFEDWVKIGTVALTQDEHTFLEASLEARLARQTAESERRQRELEQVSVGLASQALLELEGAAPERSVLLALEALEHYPYTWQAERALGQSILKNRLRQVLNHNGIMQSATWSADGTKILTGSMDQTVRLWDALNGEELVRITEGTPNMASWSPDERSILAVNEKDIIVKVWDTETGLARFTLEKDDIGGELFINLTDWEPWSPSGDRFLIYTKEGTLKTCDVQTGEALHTLCGHKGQITQVLWSPNGELFASSSKDDSTVIVWQAETGDPLYNIPGGFEDEKVCVGSWSPSGDRFATRGRGGSKVYDTATGRQILNLSVAGVFIIHVIWSPEGKRLLTSGCEDGTARLWDAESGQELDRITGLVQASSSDWSPTRDLAAVGGYDSLVHLWDVVTGKEIAELSGTVPAPWHLGFSPNGKHLLTMGSGHYVNIYDLSEDRINIPVTTFGNVTNAAWSPGGEQIAFGQCTPPDYPVKIWDAGSGEELIALLGQEKMPDHISWSPSGDRILTTNEDNTVRIWDAITWEPLLIFSGHEDIVDHWLEGANWSPDGSQIVSVDDGGKVIVWDAASGNEILNLPGHLEHATYAAWSPDGALILSTGTNGEAMVWETASGQLLHKLFPEDYNLTVAHGTWTKDGKRVVVLSVDGYVTIFDARTGEQRSQFLTTSSSSFITDFSLSPSEERILIGGHDGVARVWDIATGTQLLGYETEGFNFPSYSPDGRWALIGSTGGNEGRLQIFPAWHSAEELIGYAREHCVFRELTPEERHLFGLPEQARTDSPPNEDDPNLSGVYR